MILEKEKFRVLYNKNNMIIVEFICDLSTINRIITINNRVLDYKEGPKSIHFNNDDLIFIIPEELKIPEGKFSIKETISGDCIKEEPYIDTDGFISYHREYGPNKQEGGYYIDDKFITKIDNSPTSLFLRSLEFLEQKYFNMFTGNDKLNNTNCAEYILPMCTKSSIELSGNLSDWIYLFDKNKNLVKNINLLTLLENSLVNYGCLRKV